MSLKIVGITACTAGIAHTYIVAEKIATAAQEAGHQCKMETVVDIPISTAMKSPKSLIATIEKKLNKK